LWAKVALGRKLHDNWYIFAGAHRAVRPIAATHFEGRRSG
jgi:hypothetical protein